MYKNESSLAGCLVVIIGFVLLCLMCGWTDRTLDFWCSYFSHHAVNIPMWLSVLVTFVSNGLMFLLNIISEIIRACMGM